MKLASFTGKHPLEELDAAEICDAVQCVKAHAISVGLDVSSIRWNVVSLQEPPKVALLAYEKQPNSATLPPRQALVIFHTPPEPGVTEVVVQLQPEPAAITSWTKVEGVHALASPEDCLEAEALVKADAEVQALLADLYGIFDLTLVACDPWSVHTNPVGGPTRCIQTFMYMRSCAADNQYAHPLDITPIVDLNTKKIVRIDRPVTGSKEGAGKLIKDGKIQWNKVNNNYHRDLAGVEGGGWRADLPKPLNVTQPEGPSFTVNGNLVTWQGWSFRLGFNYREGIVLHLVNYTDRGITRPVAHRLSLVEMAVPYADPREPFVRKCAFDVGDYGLGYCASSLALGCDCLGHIHYSDAVWVNAKGEPTVLKKAVCMHEEDVGLLWKHVEYRNGHSESRRNRRLVISSIATVVNYEYAFYWYLYLDGSIALDIKLTGELSTNMLSTGNEAETGLPLYGTLVGPGVNAQHHQHMFCARLDMSVDDLAGGKDCIVSEIDVEAVPYDPQTNPYGNAFRVVETDLTSTDVAKRNIAPEKGRLWKIKNPNVTNPVSKAPAAYKLVPMAHPPLLAQPQSITAKKGVFATRQLWVTPHDDTERFPSGDYVFNATECRGLSVWTQKAKELVGADPVIWYSFGLTHIVRVEDFPVMPVEVCGFALKPFGFFVRNPTVDLPPDCNAASREVATGATTATTNMNGGNCSCSGSSEGGHI